MTKTGSNRDNTNQQNKWMKPYKTKQNENAETKRFIKQPLKHICRKEWWHKMERKFGAVKGCVRQQQDLELDRMIIIIMCCRKIW